MMSLVTQRWDDSSGPFPAYRKTNILGNAMIIVLLTWAGDQPTEASRRR